MLLLLLLLLLLLFKKREESLFVNFFFFFVRSTLFLFYPLFFALLFTFLSKSHRLVLVQNFLSRQVPLLFLNLVPQHGRVFQLRMTVKKMVSLAVVVGKVENLIARRIVVSPRVTIALTMVVVGGRELGCCKEVYYVFITGSLN